MTTACAARLRLFIALTIFAAGCALGALSDHRALRAHAAQPGAKGKDPLQPTGPDDVIKGYLSCSECHGREVGDGRNSKYKKYKSHEFVLLSEGTTWNAEDPHSAAFKVLKGDLGKQMSGILKYDVTKAPQCLTCHAIDTNPGSPLPRTEEETLKRFVRGDGVACHGCHGLRQPWLTKHTETADTPDGGSTIPWRILTPEEKERHGMRNLRDPVVKAKLCASCHVGDPDQNRVVTHDMYAAGHPPLPPFEIGTFMESQPMHWGDPAGGYSNELKFFTEKEFTAYPGGADIAKKNSNWMWDLYRVHPEAKEVHIARQITAAAIASLHAEMKLIAADAAVAAADKDGGLVDFARFDCYACHHDLKYQSDRQKRGYGNNAPGRPPLKAWASALPGVVVQHAAGLRPLADTTKDFGPTWDKVQTAALKRPFGKPDELAKSASDMAKWCDEFMKRQQTEAAPIYTKQEAEKLLALIGNETLAKWTADPEAAMHLTWAYITLRQHLKKTEQPDKSLDGLRIVLPVRVREPRKEGDKWTFSKPPVAGKDLEPMTVGETLRQRLDLFNDFNSAKFKPAFEAIHGKSR
jgi:hypothetical protein